MVCQKLVVVTILWQPGTFVLDGVVLSKVVLATGLPEQKIWAHYLHALCILSSFFMERYILHLQAQGCQAPCKQAHHQHQHQSDLYFWCLT